MQVKLGRRGDYAVRAVLNLARHHETGRRKAREIAEEMEVPQRYLPQILAALVRHGLLQATAGPDGGYTLSRPPEAISLLDVVVAAEGSLRSDECPLRGGPCDWQRVCPVHAAWARAEDALAAQLAGTTFDELAALDAQIEAGAYPAPPQPHSSSRERRGVRTSQDAPPTRRGSGRRKDSTG